MKKLYEEMKLTLVGAIPIVVDKSGPDVDSSQNYTTKSPDQGEGQENHQ